MQRKEIASTPIRQNSPLVRRSALVTPITNAIETPTVDMRQERLSSINVSAASNTSGAARRRLENTNVLHGHRQDFMSYIKMFQSNKLTKQNIWDVDLIHDFYYLVDMRDETVVGDLHLASVALDASTKLYSMRVDDVHQDVVRLASGLMRSNTKESTKKAREEDDNNDGDMEGDEAQKKKPTRARKRKPRSHIVTDLSLINGEVEVDTELDKLFTTRAAMLGDGNTTDKLFSLTLDSHRGTYVTDVHDKKIMYCDIRAEKEKKEFPIGAIPKWNSAEINPSLGQFKFLDPEQTSMCENVDIGLNSSQQEVTFDFNAPVEQIADEACNDESMIFDNNSDNFPTNDDQESAAFSGAAMAHTGKSVYGAALKKRIEYTYDPKIKRLISRLYAGPLHYKFPFQNKKSNVKSLYRDGRTRTETTESIRVRHAKKAPAHRSLKDTEEPDDEMFKRTGMHRLKGSAMLNWNPAKNALPQDLHLAFDKENHAFLRNAMKFDTTEWANATSVDELVPDYNYQNANDSNFCAVLDNAELYSDDEGNEASSSVAGTPLQENVDAPELVNRVKINYDTKVRAVDMKLVKKFTWKIIERELIKPPDGVQKKPSITFSYVFAELHKSLPHAETENLTLGIASLSVMHITNDNNLILTQTDAKDFTIAAPLDDDDE